MDIFAVFSLIGGLAFFLFGMHVMSNNLEKMAGGKLELLLKKMTTNPFVSLFLGAAITIAIQSSSATTVMLVGLVNSGIMEFGQTINVIFGADGMDSQPVGDREQQCVPADAQAGELLPHCGVHRRDHADDQQERPQKEHRHSLCRIRGADVRHGTDEKCGQPAGRAAAVL